MAVTQEEFIGLIAQVDTLRSTLNALAPGTGEWKAQVESLLNQHEVKLAAQGEEALKGLRQLQEAAAIEITGFKQRLTEADERAARGGGKGKGDEWGKAKDWEPKEWDGKEDGWKKWKEEVEDYVDEMVPGLAAVLEHVSKKKAEIKEKDLNEHSERWYLRGKLFKLLKRKTANVSEANKIVKCAEEKNGWDAWRMLALRYEAQSGVRRANELRELMQLMNKRCKNTAETQLIVVEIDRRKMIISECGGDPPDDDITTSVLLMSMDGATRSHVSGKMDMEDMEYSALRQTVMAYCTLQANTSRTGSSQAVPMDIGSIASVADSVAPSSNVDQPDWSYDEQGWPVDESGNHFDGYYDEQLNFVANGTKGNKGKGKGCFNCREQRHFAWECPKKGKGKGGWQQQGKADGKGNKGKGKGCFNCGEGGHFARECPKKGKGKGNFHAQGKGGWQGGWNPQIKMLCSLTTREPEEEEEEDFEKPMPSRTFKAGTPAKVVVSPRAAIVADSRFRHLQSIDEGEALEEVIVEKEEPEQDNSTKRTRRRRREEAKAKDRKNYEEESRKRLRWTMTA